MTPKFSKLQIKIFNLNFAWIYSKKLKNPRQTGREALVQMAHLIFLWLPTYLNFSKSVVQLKVF